MERKPRLGRGLDALLNGPADASSAPAPQAEVRLDQIHQNPLQPRKTFDEDELAALSESIKNHGILQPLVVRATDDGYQLVAGERRLRAARGAGLETVPVRVVDFNDQQVLEAALVENIHRTDLNPIEKAHGFKEYLDRFQMTHEDLAQRLGLARPTITNLVGLLELPIEIQDYVRTGQLTLGHAKVLKGLDAERQLLAVQGDRDPRAVGPRPGRPAEGAEAGGTGGGSRRAGRAHRRPSRRPPTSRASRTSCASSWPSRSRFACGPETGARSCWASSRTTISSGCWRRCGSEARELGSQAGCRLW